ncbi:hypothetical protein T440DRAFT_58140 [Plenodomus tracheiphilus IPT5]|uniref:Uncharacterized protein n=1 Tax=Plenodomus tracheiphilus IPT5 TaxID=1408161 RepID=A0A6A7B8B4_9PLEO|nr:hypothetical protein T440DRAFT_58140 [Plenodomus tracheiphilus IPT5]
MGANDVERREPDRQGHWAREGEASWPLVILAAKFSPPCPIKGAPAKPVAVCCARRVPALKKVGAAPGQQELPIRTCRPSTHTLAHTHTHTRIQYIVQYIAQYIQGGHRTTLAFTVHPPIHPPIHPSIHPTPCATTITITTTTTTTTQQQYLLQPRKPPRSHQHCTVLYCPALHCTASHRIALHCTSH